MTGVITDAELARSITDRPYLSWSQFQSYQNCPRAFAFRYVDQADPEFTPSALIFGGAFHGAVSFHNEARLEGLDSPTIDTLLDLVRDELEPVTVPIRFNKDENLDALMDLAQRMLTAFMASKESEPDGEVVGIEEPVTGSIDPDFPDMTGVVDLVTLTKDGIVVTDYKTTRSSWSSTKVDENAGQIRVYGELLVDRLGEENGLSELRFVTISKAKSPKVGSHTVSVDDSKLQATKDQIREVWRGIQAGVFPARPSWQCRTCPFQSQCDAAAI